MGGRDRGGRMSDMGPDKTDTDWRARPSSDQEEKPPRRDDAFGESESSQLTATSPQMLATLFRPSQLYNVIDLVGFFFKYLSDNIVWSWSVFNRIKYPRMSTTHLMSVLALRITRPLRVGSVPRWAAEGQRPLRRRTRPLPGSL